MGRSRLSGKISVLLMLFLAMAFRLNAQDPSLTNFHITKNYLNPAYAGYSKDLSLNLNNRIQWVKVSRFTQLNTYTMAANLGCDDLNLGFGLYAFNNVEGEGMLRTTSAGMQVARYWPFNYRRKGTSSASNRSIFSAGLQFGAGQKRLDWSELVFSDQLSNDTYRLVRASSLVSPQNSHSEFSWDLAAGVRMMSELGRQGSFSAGLAAFHPFTNQESFFTDNSDILWPVRYTAHLFFSRDLAKAMNDFEVSVGGIYNRQAGLNSFTIMGFGAYVSTLKIGVGYRGKDQGLPDAVVFQGTFRGGNLWGRDDWLVSINYELTTLSSVGQHRSGGTLELGLVLVIDNSSICGNRDIGCFHPSKKLKDQSIWGF